MPLDRVTFIEDWYDRLVARTNEKTVLPDAIRSLLSGPKKTCLEIGLGTTPFFANQLSALFDSYTILEKQTEAKELPENSTIVKGDWEHFESGQTYDVILASHVIYYFADKKAAIEKMIEALSPGGQLFIVVNGKDGDYGPLKSTFSDMVNHPYTFTYDVLVRILEGRVYGEYSFPTTIPFSSGEDLFETLRLSFDQYPEEYEELKDQLVDYFDANVKDGTFTINQKIFVVTK